MSEKPVKETKRRFNYGVMAILWGALVAFNVVRGIIFGFDVFVILMIAMTGLFFARDVKEFLDDHRVNVATIAIVKDDETGETKLEDRGTEHGYDFKGRGPADGTR
jgi:hypothetical protein